MKRKQTRSRCAGTLSSLKADLESLGVASGDKVIVHSSFKSLGWIEGGPATVVRALQETVTKRGMILMPSFSFNFDKVYEPPEPFDSKHSPSKVGLIAETFRKIKGVRRSGHPTHSVAVWGKNAAQLVDGHELHSAFAPGTPMERAARTGAKLLLIGCDFRALSLLHVAEELAGLPYLPIFNWGQEGFKSAALFARKGAPQRIDYNSVPGCSRGFLAAQRLALKKGLLNQGNLGCAPVLLGNAGAILEMAVAQLAKRPDWLLCPATCPACDDRRSVFDCQKSAGAEFIGNFMIQVIAKAGIRQAGSEGEERAARIIAQHMRELGLSNVQTLRPQVPAWQPAFSRVEVFLEGRWQKLPSAPGQFSAGTQGKVLKGDTVEIESLEQLDWIEAPRNKIGVLWNGYGNNLAEFKRFMGSGLRAFIYIDRRFHHDEIVALGLPAQWAEEYRVPTVTVPFATAARLFGRGPVRCRLFSNSRTVPGYSTVVSGEIPGKIGETIIVSGHHDSCFNSPAADDNLAGVAASLEVARLLKGQKLRRTLRICSFGAEEMLSEGSRWYVTSAGGAKEVCFVVNNDSVSSRIGVTGLHLTGTPEMTEWFKRAAARAKMPFDFIEDVCPFSDQFPFNAQGIPSAWFYRETTTTGRHYHHTVHDTLGAMSFEYIARLAAFEAGFLLRLANASSFPFPTGFSEELRQQVSKARKAWMTA